jgi:Peptidase family M1 domain
VSRLGLLFFGLAAILLAGPSAADLAHSLRAAGLDPAECYRVRDLSFQKEDIRVYLTDGYLIFSKPVAGFPRSAVFTAEVEGGDGEVLLLPPTRSERESLALFTKSANLDEHFRAALMLFTDGSASALAARIRETNGRKAPEMGSILAEKWGGVLGNVQSSFELRMVEDILLPPEEGGMLFLALNGREAGNFDMMYDPRSRDQIVAGALAEHNGRLSYNIWTSFPARSSRSGSRKKPDLGFRLTNYKIEAALDSDLRVKAATRVGLRLSARPSRVFAFDISRAMRMDAVRIDGAPAELFIEESLRGRALRGNDNDTFLVVAPEELPAASEHTFEFEHEGNIIVNAGRGVYFVGARATWYPRSGDAFCTYDVQFRYPKRLTLVTAGDQVEDRLDGDARITRWRTPVPIRLIGFNLGEYEKVSGSARGFTVDVYGNRRVQTGLEPPPVPPSSSDPQIAHRRIPDLHGAAMPLPPDPLARLKAVASDVSSALDFFTTQFGPPALKTLTVAPIPGAFGQGFPGLVYLSTLSYLDPEQRPAALRDAEHRLFFSELIEAHEVAHQWWGNVVTIGAYQDEWLPEALANYSALMWLEKKKGARALDNVLEDYRNHLTAKDPDGREVESAGPIIWGPRLNSLGIQDAWRTITYEKGAWIFHMLRRRMGDDRFQKMLVELRKRFEFRAVSTDDLRALVREFLPPGVSPASVEMFFDNWVYSTGVPGVNLKYSSKGAAPAVKVSGTVALTGVAEDFAIDIPVEIQFAKGSPQTIWVRASDEPAPFSAAVKQAVVRVVVPASVLVKK